MPSSHETFIPPHEVIGHSDDDPDPSPLHPQITQPDDLDPSTPEQTKTPFTLENLRLLSDQILHTLENELNPNQIDPPEFPDFETRITAFFQEFHQAALKLNLPALSKDEMLSLHHHYLSTLQPHLARILIKTYERWGKPTFANDGHRINILVSSAESNSFKQLDEPNQSLLKEHLHPSVDFITKREWLDRYRQVRNWFKTAFSAFKPT